MAVYKQHLDKLAAHILAQNPYLSCGYGLAWIDPQKGGVYGYKSAAKGDFERVAVFPNDRGGPCFYLRPEMQANYRESEETSLSDCASGTMQENSVFLVAFVDRADPYELIENLLHTLAAFSGVRLSGSDWNRESVAIRELQGLDKKDIEATLARLGRYAIVSVSFTLSTPILFQGQSCRQSPVLSCNP